MGTTRINLGKIYDATIEAIDVYGYKYTTAVIGEPATETGTTNTKTAPVINLINPK
jgi:hypothetical protein